MSGVFKVFVDSRIIENRTLYGFSIYNDNSEILFSDVKMEFGEVDRFDRLIRALMFTVGKLKLLVENKTLPEPDKLYIVIGSKTVYKWFENEEATKKYKASFSELLFEMAFLTFDVEIVYAEKVASRVTFKSSVVEDEGVKATELFDMLGVMRQ